ncbi:hypothetical protein ACUOFC_65165, partial [Escherichia sp. TWPC-MK]
PPVYRARSKMAARKATSPPYNAVEHYNEIKPQLLTTGGTSDGRFIARMGAQVVELGPVNSCGLISL